MRLWLRLDRAQIPPRLKTSGAPPPQAEPRKAKYRIDAYWRSAQTLHGQPVGAKGHPDVDSLLYRVKRYSEAEHYYPRASATSSILRDFIRTARYEKLAS